MGRLTTSNTQTFHYDAASNLTCNQSGQYQTYNFKGELNINYQTCVSTSIAQDNFTYDAYGDRIEELVPWGSCQIPLYYEYVNSVGEMTGYTAFFTQTNYAYSGNGQLLSITQGSTTLAQMTWDEAASTPKILSDNTWDFIYGPGGTVFEAIKAGTPVYLVNDAVGSPLGNLSTNGTLNNSHVFNTWGDSPPSGAPPIGFDNAYYDGASTFYYLMNRWYDPNTGQFTTEDPRILATGQPWGYGGVAGPGTGGQATTTPMGIDETQIYQFGNDNPVSVRDVTGLCGGRGGESTGVHLQFNPAQGLEGGANFVEGFANKVLGGYEWDIEIISLGFIDPQYNICPLFKSECNQLIQSQYQAGGNVGWIYRKVATFQALQNGYNWLNDLYNAVKSDLLP